MPNTTQQTKAVRFRELHHGPRILILPNAWDAASARIFEEAGFPAVATTSAGLANALGYPDGQYVPRDELLAAVRRIVRITRIPVTVDAEAGFGVTTKEVVETIQELLASGAVGINLEDRQPNPQEPLATLDSQVEKIRAIREAADAVGIPLVINARTDAFRVAGADSAACFDTAVERANAYRRAGADCLFVPFVSDAATIGALVRAIDGPINILPMPGTPPVAELERLGVRRVSVGSGPHRATLALTRRIAHELRDQGTYTAFMEQTIPYPEVNRLFERTQDEG